MKKRTLRIYYVSFILISLSIIFFLFIKTFNENLLFYRSPSQITVGEFPQDYIFRVGGVVLDGTLVKSKNSTNVKFAITDYEKVINISYNGILPDLFREGQGVVIRGKLGDDGVFYAEEVLAKHDETYMPPEISDSLKMKEKTIEDTTKSMNIYQ
ncbi:MAG: cytochrome c maturation protein CcmE [Gammaproteobacteria bacterium]|jgi:cytochrome c-type biogenesis protein CcmE|nr:cytochrome c maturation protein CcmE [Gammaproteobacteria bacterium]MBT4462614.1 cytochrome c maturation protein CcmE [Gammaproteobacteria bacterium]MBT4654861.1 cytochrome c maturation protein CcmE [Gammaproteobacteria bacterium]MBT5116639.1 cytochrome c maturation protein CcmE [Gammaproteobacteria bacterium]MBT5761734.1 cytochrome c maturation protein CcmE [Gammaproteobacteria bacterium]